jgi:hypothetical protein
MGYGEYGGGGSIQNAVWLSEPDVQATQLNRGAEAWQRLKENELSKRARAFIPRIEDTDLTFFGKDETPTGLGSFRVRFRFQSEGEIREVAAAFQKAMLAKQLEVEFQMAVVRDSPGQIRLAWDKHAQESLGDDIPNGTSGGRRTMPRGLLGLWYRFLQLFR